uniref:Acyl-CoA thioesterase 6 n=2 Tax=Canis lupus familiaris TaxID=9615 RepID=A0A8P0PFC2_CANLF
MATVSLEPAGRCAWDEPVRISVRGLAPGQPVTLRASLRDERGALFRAHARYRADDRGLLDLARAPALGGSFVGLEPMGLLWALEPETPFWRFVKRDVQTPFAVELEVLDGHEPDAGRLLGRALHARHFLRPGVRRVPVRAGRVRGTLFLPPGPGPFPGIIDIFGIGGGLVEYRASLLAGHGFATFALAYYNFEDLPKEIDSVDLDYFEEALCYMLQHSEVKGPGIGLLGISLGADICLSMASFLKNISATVSINGSGFSGNKGIRYKQTFIPPLGHDLRRIKVAFSGILDIVDIRNDVVGGHENPSMIPMEKAQGPILFIVGQDDHNWRSAGPFPGIIDLYGSGGGLCEYRASLLAGHGFAALALAYFRFEDLPEYLDDLQLEYFEEAVNFMLQHPKVKGPNVGLLGFSKGGDLCLSMASFLKGITATVLINSCVANTVAPLPYKDMIIPSLGSDPKRYTINESGLLNFMGIWENPLEGSNQKSIIPFERAQGPFLFIVGMDDNNWKSSFYAQIASERLQANGKDRPEIICYKGTGHCIEPPYFPVCRASVHAVLGQPICHGGEPEFQSRAQVDAWQRIQTFFHKHLNGQKPVQSSKL